MNLQDTLYFPGTAILSGSQYPLFLFFPAIHLLQPVEPAAEGGNPGESADLFIKHGFCQAHTPAPLGAERARFLRLVEDIGRRKDDYAAQLSSLTVAAMSAPRQQDDDTPQGILSSLLGSPQGQQVVEQDAGQNLWQARLVLAIGEMLDREEEEIARELALLEESEQDLFQRLHGEDYEELEALDEEDYPLAELLGINARKRQQSTTTIRNRCRAWERLFLAGDLPGWRTWCTHWPDAADAVFERYEKATGKAAVLAGSLPLPATVGSIAGQAFAALTSFRQSHAGLAGEIVAALPDGLTPGLADRWQAALDEYFPLDQFGRTTMSIHHLPEKGIPALLGKEGEAGSGSVLLVIADPA
ncbi:MAG: hypothetical protein F9K24_21980 [Leptonema illini]|uniref:Uncharacterized protein n=1 Tax=Leptonema illini TaxID=183 RepID=A0A833LWS8_9LEPT|nr:MAG: hypothetical protein F9K24_21980 [Leptonema illini]